MPRPRPHHCLLWLSATRKSRLTRGSFGRTARTSAHSHAAPVLACPNRQPAADRWSGCGSAPSTSAAMVASCSHPTRETGREKMGRERKDRSAQDRKATGRATCRSSESFLCVRSMFVYRIGSRTASHQVRNSAKDMSPSPSVSIAPRARLTASGCMCLRSHDPTIQRRHSCKQRQLNAPKVQLTK